MRLVFSDKNDSTNMLGLPLEGEINGAFERGINTDDFCK